MNAIPLNQAPLNGSADAPRPSGRAAEGRVKALVIGCGNVLRGDDAAGPVLIRRMWERGLPEGARCADGGTGGMDVAFQMRGVPHVILVDACRSGSEPGTIFELPGEEVEQLPPIEGINLHAFRWDHAIAFARWLLKDEYPEQVSVFLIEGSQFEMGAELSPEVDAAIDRLAARIFERLEAETAGDRPHVAQGPPEISTMSGTPLDALVRVVPEAGRWVVYLNVPQWEAGETQDHPVHNQWTRINDYATREDAEVAATWYRRSANRKIRPPTGF